MPALKTWTIVIIYKLDKLISFKKIYFYNILNKVKYFKHKF